jgi:hypothetical protein
MILNHNGLISVLGVIARDWFVLSPVEKNVATAIIATKSGSPIL